MIRDDIKAALVTAMKSGDKARTATLRLVQSSLKNRDIELRGAAAPADDDVIVTEVLQKMVKQRRESVALYEQGGRQELADAETAEIAVIEGFLPSQMCEVEAKAAIEAIVAETGASSVKDMGRVMAAVKERHAGKMDMSRASGLVKARLSA
ncbi:MAG: GatB/YqeY domain-containing protein [Allosphingosinicella sp.]